MRVMKRIILYLGILIILIGSATAQQTKEVTCTGKVIDDEGRTVGNVKVKLYERVNDIASGSYDLKLTKETTTDADGVFSFNTNARSNSLMYGYVAVEKEKLAPGWALWKMREDNECEIKLSQVGELTGCVVDENDKPVEQAEVSFYMLRTGDGDNRQYMSSKLASMLYIVNTDNAGRFTFTNVPADAKADLLVRKTGRATITTYINSSSLHYSPGQNDIKLIQPIEAKIEGICVEKDSGKPVAGLKLMMMQDWNRSLLGHKPVVSKEDGTFSINGLGAGKCIFLLVTPRQGLAEWASKPVEVMNEAGKTISDVKIELSKGGILEVTVKDAQDKKPLEFANVNIREPRSNMTFNTRSDEDGIARIRLIPGEYRIFSVSMQGYTSDRSSKDMITIEAGKTKRLEYELAVQPKITGVVRDDKGRPLKDVELRIWPFGPQKFTSNAEGKFEIDWDPEFLHAGIDATYSLIGRHEERNLSVNSEIDMETKTMDIELQPGVSLTGKVVETNGRAIEGAKVMVMMRALNLGTSLKPDPERTDAEGHFEIRAIPSGIRYSISLGADGYSRINEDINIEQAENGNLDIGTLTLSVANLTVSGVVVDENNKPVANIKVVSAGRNQPYDSIQTDVDGKFVIKACKGRVEIRANSTGSPRMSGSVRTEGGATDIKIVISERSSGSRFVPKQPPSLVGKPLPELQDLKIELSSADANDKMMLVCFWDMEQRPSRNCIIQLAKKAQELKANDVVIVAIHTSKVEAKTLNKWVMQKNISFPVGMVQGDEEKTRFAWGVRSLPWLILTDKQHLVTAEGFNPSELDEKHSNNSKN